MYLIFKLHCPSKKQVRRCCREFFFPQFECEEGTSEVSDLNDLTAQVMKYE